MPGKAEWRDPRRHGERVGSWTLLERVVSAKQGVLLEVLRMLGAGCWMPDVEADISVQGRPMCFDSGLYLEASLSVFEVPSRA